MQIHKYTCNMRIINSLNKGFNITFCIRVTSLFYIAYFKWTILTKLKILYMDYRNLGLTKQVVLNFYVH